jgi:heat shock protein HtpX
MWLWTKLGVLLCMKTSRDNEYEADRFSSNCGYNRELIDAFETLAADSESPKGIFATLSSSHPDFDDRIAMLQSYQKKEVMS